MINKVVALVTYSKSRKQTHQTVLGVKIVTDEDFVLESLINEMLDSLDPLSVRRHVNLGAQVEV